MSAPRPAATASTARPWPRADFGEDSEEKRPTVQVGDPVHREAADRGLPRADGVRRDRRDPGHGRGRPHLLLGRDGVARAASASSSTWTTVPLREEGMTPYEMMLSESQERMLMVLKPGREAEAEAIFRKWELDFAVIGHVTDTGRMVLKWQRRDRRATSRSARSPTTRRSTTGPHVPTPKPAPLDRRAREHRHRRRPAQADGLARPRQPPLDLGAIRPHGRRRHRPAPRRRRRGRARPRHRRRRWRSPPTARRAIAIADPYRGRQAGDRRSLAQPLPRSARRRSPSPTA